MRVLHVVKTSIGADFAARQILQLVKAGIDVDLVLPAASKLDLLKWNATGARLHFLDFDFPVRQPWRILKVLREVRRFVGAHKPDIIHSHFFGTSVVLRHALGRAHPVPRIFQVPGPLHLESCVFRLWDLLSAGSRDYWVASSEYIAQLYRRAGVKDSRIFCSYYGIELNGNNSNQSANSQAEKFSLRDSLLIPPGTRLVGNASYMYPPKYYLGQTVGIKCHEDMIDAIASVTSERADVIGVLIGGAWNGAHAYEQRLVDRAQRLAGDRIKMVGRRSTGWVHQALSELDLVVHVPLSENCGGVVEALLQNVPVIASRVGGLPEIIEDGVTGDLVEPRNVLALTQKISDVLDDLENAKARAQVGKLKVQHLFDVSLTSQKILSIYKEILRVKG